jgi:hypothetical protein
VLRAEAVEEAERNLDARLAPLRDIGDVKVESVIREGEAAEEIEQRHRSGPRHRHPGTGRLHIQ